MGHREDLLAAARRLLEEKGYAHITARDLVAASNTNLASIGYHFGSKAGLLNAAMGAIFEEWMEELAKVVMADPSAAPVQRGQLTWTTMLASLSSKRALLLSFFEALAQVGRTPSLREQFAAQYRHMRARVAGYVAETLGPDADPEEPRCRAVASFVIAVCDGLSVQWLLDPDGAPTAEELQAGLDVMWSRSLLPGE